MCLYILVSHVFVNPSQQEEEEFFAHAIWEKALILGICTKLVLLLDNHVTVKPCIKKVNISCLYGKLCNHVFIFHCTKSGNNNIAQIISRFPGWVERGFPVLIMYINKTLLADASKI